MSVHPDHGETPLPGQVWCDNGHLNSGMADYCKTCGALIKTDDETQSATEP